MSEVKIQPNSQRYKETLKIDNDTRLGPAISSGRAKVQKKSGVSKFANTIISEDAQNVKSYIVMDVLIPSFKKAISDIVTNGIDIVLYGESGGSKKSNAGRVSYRNYYDGRGNIKSSRYDNTETRDRGSSRSNRQSVSLFDDIVVETRGDAEDILSRMSEYLDNYPVISVADMYDLANITSFPHTYNNYGWKSIASAKTIRVNDGYLIKMPPVEPLK